MAIAFRVRPTFVKGNNQILFKNLMPASNRLDEGPMSPGKPRIASVIADSLEQMVLEMDFAGRDMGVLMGVVPTILTMARRTIMNFLNLPPNTLVALWFSQEFIRRIPAGVNSSKMQ